MERILRESDSEADNRMAEHRYQEHPFPPLYDKNSGILILGSFPSVKSREQEFFYGHPRNRFWMTLAGVLSRPVPETVEEKKAFLKENHIALWDVIKSCEIRGSSDSSIKNVTPNDLSRILSDADIRRIYCNGTTSYRYFCKYQQKTLGVEAVKLPSTSPANAAYSLSRLIDEWKEICIPLKAAPPGLAGSLLHWYDYNGRTLPWRSNPTPYHVWVSEIMLQQTRVETVMGYYERFMKRYPSVGDLAQASEEELMKCWEGLGYYRRARHLREAAKEIADRYGGDMPSDYKSLLRLPGIGEYTAGAVSSIAFKQKVPAIDGNVFRVYARLLGEEREISKAGVKRDIRREVLRTMPDDRPGDFNQALMDLGAKVCLPVGRPKCEECPWDTVCLAHSAGAEEAYPVRRKIKSRRIEYKTVLRIEYRDKLILRKRDNQGLLAGLWELPNLDDRYSPDKLEDLLEEENFPDYSLTPLGEAKHIFSHAEWRMTGYRIVLQDLPDRFLEDRGWIQADREKINERYAIPSAFDSYR